MKYMTEYIKLLTTARLDDKATVANINSIVLPAVISEKKIIERTMRALPFNGKDRKKLAQSRDYITSQIEAYQNRLRKL